MCVVCSLVTCIGTRAESPSEYRKYADVAAAALQKWYDTDRGLWNTTGWWNSANALEAVIDYSARTGARDYLTDLGITFEKHKAGSFLNRYYDDEGWWALTWIKAYDLTYEPEYLALAKTIFDDMKGGWDDTYGGGIWWSKDRKYKNAIANELFLTLAARLHQHTPGDKGAGSYLDWAAKEWNWFQASGMIDEDGLVNDGLNSQGKNNGKTTWTYNQGVVLGGLLAMNEITRDRVYIARAEAIADAAIRTLISASGTLQEPCEHDDGCGGDGPQFKGIFMRNLGVLYRKTRNRKYREFIQRNASSLWKNDRNDSDQFGLKWSGPFDRADASRQTSALDAFNAAL
jgi:predicted alpha-1,6-mannanase (GH76 family)